MAIVIKIKLVPFFMISEPVNTILEIIEITILREFIVSGINIKRSMNAKSVLIKLIK